MPCVACGKPLAGQSDNQAPASSLEIAAFQGPHIKRATICLWIAAVLLAIPAVVNSFRIAKYEERLEAFRRDVAQAERSDGIVIGLDWAQDELREAEESVGGAKLVLALQIVLAIVFVIAALALKRSPRGASLAAAFFFGGYLFLMLIVAPGALLLPDTLLVTLMMAVVLYFAVVAGKKIQQTDHDSL
jgi:hypothetical protein